MSAVNVDSIRDARIEENLVRRWISDDFNGRSITFLKGDIEKMNYHLRVIGSDGEVLRSTDLNILGDPEAEEILNVFVKVYGLEDGRKKIHQAFIAKLVENKWEHNIPTLNFRGDVSYQPVEVVSSWRTYKPGNGWLKIEKEVELLKVHSQPEQNDIFKWRISEGKIQKILNKQNVMCHFPLANPIFLHDLSSPVVWPRVLEKTKTDFLEDHLLTHIKESPRVTEIFFDARYLSKKSKFNPSKRVTPYEWGVTLISYARDKDFSVEDWGHAALVIESIKDGWHYHAKKIHVYQWKVKGIKIPSDVGKVGVLDVECLQKGKDKTFPNLTHSRTWIRKRECIENMLSFASRQVRNQTISNPAVYLNGVGREAVISDFFYDIVSSSLPRRGVNEFGFQEEKENKSDKKHNCVTWAVDMLQKADIDVDTGTLKKLFVSLPRDYGNHSLSTRNHDDHPIIRTRLTKILNSAIKNSDDALRQIFVTGVFFSRNHFVASGNLPQGKIRAAYTLIDDQFLVHLTA